MTDTNPDILLLHKISGLWQKATHEKDNSDWKRQLDTCDTKAELEILSNIKDLFILLKVMKTANRPHHTLP